MRAIGFHGTSAEAAQRILASGFEISRNEYDWLGDGAYFFQDAPVRAMEWARHRFGRDAAVVGAEIDLADCIDLLDIPWERLVKETHQLYVARFVEAGRPLPVQTPGAHRLDRHVLNYFVDRVTADGLAARSLRAAFVEGRPLFPGSALYNRAHVQIAVRNLEAITRVWLREEE
ncbi:MAG TPA: hypothetical protein VEQ60_14625 [Longimicrobium sp.]|nr:hypothetical protein [Longimicrobium sp.]